MTHRRVRAEVGCVFLVPLRDRGYCIGVLTKASGDGHAFGYFFGQRVQGAKEVRMSELHARNAILVGQFGDLELVRSKWPVIGKIEPWDDAQWSMPSMARIDESVGRAWLSTYDENFACLEETEISVSEARKYPYDRMMGAGAPS